jgi:SAM-dependent methyltransferase
MPTDPRALVGLDLSGLKGLEIGPLHRPIISKSESEVYYLDHCSSDALRRKYADAPDVDIASIVELDFIADGRPFAELMAATAPFDYVAASHVIEHVPDIVGWLLDVQSILKDGGALCLWNPDKRFTFDLHRRISSREEVAAAHAERRTRPGLRVIQDFYAYISEVPHALLWDDYRRVKDVKYKFGTDVIESGWRRYMAGEYVDIHCWVFTPWSFLDLIGWITREYGLAFDLFHFAPTAYCDFTFVVQLRKNPSGKSATDWELETRRAFAMAPRPLYAREAEIDIGMGG